MNEVQQWLGVTFRTIVAWLGAQWAVFARGVMYEWPIGYFVLGMAVLLVIGVVTIWHQGTNR